MNFMTLVLNSIQMVFIYLVSDLKLTLIWLPGAKASFFHLFFLFFFFKTGILIIRTNGKEDAHLTFGFFFDIIEPLRCY